MTHSIFNTGSQFAREFLTTKIAFLEITHTELLLQGKLELFMGVTLQCEYHLPCISLFCNYGPEWHYAPDYPSEI